MEESDRIIFFDGICSLCNELIDIIISWDTKKRIKVASLQGVTAKKRLSDHFTQQLDTLVYLKKGEIYTKTDAAIRVFADINPIFKGLYLFLIIPSSLRNPLYNIVAKYRYKWFGKRETCRLPSEEEKEYFLP